MWYVVVLILLLTGCGGAGSESSGQDNFVSGQGNGNGNGNNNAPSCSGTGFVGNWHDLNQGGGVGVFNSNCTGQMATNELEFTYAVVDSDTLHLHVTFTSENPNGLVEFPGNYDCYFELPTDSNDWPQAGLLIDCGNGEYFFEKD